MIKELLRIIYSADQLISQQLMPDKEECTQVMVSCVRDLEEIDEKIRQHFQEEIQK